MRIVAFSDIHSNLEALNAIFSQIEKINPDILICAGDIVGLGPNPNEVSDIIKRQSNLVIVKGDFDDAVATGNTLGFDNISRKTIEWTREKITQQNLEFLKSLPTLEARKFGDYNFLIVHGSPIDHLKGYVYEDVSNEELRYYFKKTKAHVILVGHTHMPFIKKLEGKYIFNLGSVGQPRDRNNKASFGIINIEKNRIKLDLKRIKYDIKKTIEKIESAGLPKELGERLHDAW